MYTPPPWQRAFMAPHWRILFDVSLEFKDCTFNVVSRYVSSMKLKRVWFLLLFLFVLRPSPLSSPPNRTPTSVCRSQTDAEESSALLLLTQRIDMFERGKKNQHVPSWLTHNATFFVVPPPRCYFYKKKNVQSWVIGQQDKRKEEEEEEALLKHFMDWTHSVYPNIFALLPPVRRAHPG